MNVGGGHRLQSREISVHSSGIAEQHRSFSERQGGKFVIHKVTGPDEYTTVVDNNLFTNLMAAENLACAADAVDRLRVEAPQDYRRLVERIGLLDDEGWEPGQVALITTGSRHSTQVMQQEQEGQQGYWASYFEGEEVFYGHVLGCKGLERSAVVLCLNEDGTRDRARERLYVGMSRATDLLVVVGDPEVVRAVGGPEVARRLGL